MNTSAARLRCPKLNSCPARSRIICTPTARPRAEHEPVLGRAAACQRSDLHHGLRQRAVSLLHTQCLRLSRALIAGGFTFGEAAWAAQPVLSWQTTVVGDRFTGLLAGTVGAARGIRAHPQPADRMSYLRIVDLGLVHGTPAAQLAAFLETIPATTN